MSRRVPCTHCIKRRLWNLQQSGYFLQSGNSLFSSRMDMWLFRNEIQWHVKTSAFFFTIDAFHLNSHQLRKKSSTTTSHLMGKRELDFLGGFDKSFLVNRAPVLWIDAGWWVSPWRVMWNANDHYKLMFFSFCNTMSPFWKLFLFWLDVMFQRNLHILNFCWFL